jgi:hypothetical protein
VTTCGRDVSQFNPKTDKYIPHGKMAQPLSGDRFQPCSSCFKITEADPGWHCWWEEFVGWTISEIGNQDAIAWALLLRDGQRVLVVERTYRQNTKVFRDPTDADIEQRRSDAWKLWNR